MKERNAYTGNIASSLFLLQGWGVCAAFSAYYIIDKLIYRGNFWDFLPDETHQLAVVSEYLDEKDYRILGAEAVMDRCLKLLQSHGLKVSEPYRATGPSFTADWVFDLLLRQRPQKEAVFCVIRRKSSTANEGHAIAAINGHQRFLMDPNTGEVEFGTRRDARVFFRKHFQTYLQAGFSKAVFYLCTL